MLLPERLAADDKLTLQQRLRIDSRLENASKDVRQGKIIGPLHNAADMVASMKSDLRKRAAAKKAALNGPSSPTPETITMKP